MRLLILLLCTLLVTGCPAPRTEFVSRTEEYSVTGDGNLSAEISVRTTSVYNLSVDFYRLPIDPNLDVQEAFQITEEGEPLQISYEEKSSGRLTLYLSRPWRPDDELELRIRGELRDANSREYQWYLPAEARTEYTTIFKIPEGSEIAEISPAAGEVGPRQCIWEGQASPGETITFSVRLNQARD